MTDSTSRWLQLTAQTDAQVNAGVDDFDTDGCVVALTDIGLIAASGEEATHFLHNQLTNDVEHLGDGEARLAGYCSPKGRLLATMLMWKSADAIMLALPQPIQASIQKRLQMFVLRAKVKLTDASGSHAVLGLTGHAAAAALAEWFSAVPDAPYAKTGSAAGTLIRIADAGGVPRYQWIATIDTALAAWPVLVKTLRPASADLWRLTDVHAGIPQVTQATQEKFVPQMINFELIGGVNFKKGCYPGQEIVARSQYLGKLKRRMLPASLHTTNADAGTEVFASNDPEQPCGMIVNAAAGSVNTMECLVEIKTSVIEEDGVTIHLGSVDGPVLQFKPSPYPLADAARFN